MTEYLTEVESIPSTKQMSWFGKRKELVEKYAWAIPNTEVIQRLRDMSPLVEMGAGSGYWAYEIEKMGGTVHAYDIDPPEDTWIDITQGNEEVLHGYTEPLLLCWPPVNKSMATRAVDAHNGEYVIHVGEMRGCTADDSFFYYMDEHYTLEEVIDIPSYEHIHDNCFIYKKR